MSIISSAAEGFMALFQAGGETLLGWMTGIIPMIICLMTAVNSIIKIIGEEKFYNFASKLTGNVLGRYVVVPVMAILFLGSPSCFTFGKFCENKYKPAYYDSCISFVHPVTGLFPHANSAELFVFLGIADGVSKLGYETGGLAVRYFLVGLIVILFRGIVTEKIYGFMIKSKG